MTNKPLYKLDGLEKKAYFCWRNQVARCNHKNRKDYKNYGAKGVKVRYGVREFIQWWLAEYSKKQLKMPNVGRIDHNGDYEFGNIEMIEKSENSKEMHARRGNPGGNRRSIWIQTPHSVHVFSTIRLAAQTLDVPTHMISDIAHGRRRARPDLAAGFIE